MRLSHHHGVQAHERGNGGLQDSAAGVCVLPVVGDEYVVLDVQEELRHLVPETPVELLGFHFGDSGDLNAHGKLLAQPLQHLGRVEPLGEPQLEDLVVGGGAQGQREGRVDPLANGERRLVLGYGEGGPPADPDPGLHHVKVATKHGVAFLGEPEVETLDPL